MVALFQVQVIPDLSNYTRKLIKVRQYVIAKYYF